MDIDLAEKYKFTATNCNVKINGIPIVAILDSGAATSVMTHKLMKNIGEEISQPSNVIISTVSGETIRSLGIVEEAQINVNGELVPLDIEVIDDRRRNKLILENDFLFLTKAKINYATEKVTLYPQTRKRMDLPIEFYNGYEEDTEESDDESEDENDSETEYVDDEVMEEVQLREL